MTHTSMLWKRVFSTIALAFVSLTLVWSGTAQAAQTDVALTNTPSSLVPYASYLYLFMPSSQTFITLPLANGARPARVAVSGTHPTHVWVTEYGLNRIAHVVFTNTTSYSLAAEYPITSQANSGPFLITVDGSN